MKPNLPNRAMRPMWWGVLGLAVGFALSALWTNRVLDDHFTLTITRVVDGDTFVFDRAGWEHRLRLEGVDTPEMRGDCEAERMLAIEAMASAADFIASGEAVLITDGTTDSFNRRLGRIEVNGEDLGEALLAAGLAVPYERGAPNPWCEDDMGEGE